MVGGVYVVAFPRKLREVTLTRAVACISEAARELTKSMECDGNKTRSDVTMQM